jgi:hypothetical protein
MSKSRGVRRRWAGLALGLAVLVAGCGSHGAGPDASTDAAGDAAGDTAGDGCTAGPPQNTFTTPTERCPSSLACTTPGSACQQFVTCCGVEHGGSFFYCDCSGRYQVYMNVDPVACLGACPDGAASSSDR